jgi:dTDP-4-amino-4,6-dideoxygalactose transaminase
VPGATGESIARALADRGVATTYPSTLASLPALQARVGGATGPLAGAATLVRELVTLPTHSLLGAGEIDRLGRELRRLIDG